MRGRSLETKLAAKASGALAALVLAAGLMAGATAFAAEDGELRRTWDRAEIWIHPKPFGFFNGRLIDDEVQSVLRRLPAETKLPTVIYLHGCAYRKPAGWTYARWLVKAGYAVIMPDSFQRPNRPKTCDLSTRWRDPDAPYDDIQRMRQEEIRYAVEQVKTLSWVDQDNLFLMGHDEGGDAVAAYAGDEFKARVISGATCSRGLAGRPGLPTLALASEADAWFEGAPPDSCARLAASRGMAIESLTVPGFWHDLSGIADAREAIIDFFLRHTTR